LGVVQKSVTKVSRVAMSATERENFFLVLDFSQRNIKGMDYEDMNFIKPAQDLAQWKILHF
jgi:hypothetical protein